MKERGIIFSAPMIRALLDRTKTQTRRIVNMDTLRARLPYEVHSDLPWLDKAAVRAVGSRSASMNRNGAVSVTSDTGTMLGVKPGEFDFVCPYADGTTRLVDHVWRIEPRAQQRLWVRETFCFDVAEGPSIGVDGHSNAHEVIRYRATDRDPAATSSGWHPSIHMPRHARLASRSKRPTFASSA